MGQGPPSFWARRETSNLSSMFVSGAIIPPMSSHRSLPERFWSKVDKNGPTMPGMSTPCWVWTGATSGGYGQIGLGNGKIGKASRVVWELQHGAAPGSEKCVLHHCDNPPCVNPEHLFLGTQKDNALDREAKGRMPHPSGDAHHARRHPERLARGAEHGNAKLSSEQVTVIREAYKGGRGEQLALAQKYNVDAQTIRRIVQNKTYTQERV